MLVMVEVAEAHINDQHLRESLTSALRIDLGVKVAVELAPEGELDSLTNRGREGKVRRLLDRRPGYTRSY
jgi:hypothetical protein